MTVNAGYDVTEVQHNGTTLSASDVSGNVYTYSYTVALNNSFSISTYKHPKLVGDAYEIAYAEDLYWFSSQVNNGNTTINGKLVADIVLNEHVLDANGKLNGNGAGFRVWNPIGSIAQKYNGVFDGQDHTISGLYFNDDSQSGIGLFGRLGTRGKIMNVGVIDSYFNARYDVGGICGSNDCVVENCFNRATCKAKDGGGGIVGSIYSGDIVNCYNMGDISGEYERFRSPQIGGVCGYNYKGSILNSKNSGTLSTRSSSAGIGGICGKNENGKISLCQNTGILVSYVGNPVYGGVCGLNTGTIDNCYNTAAITASSDFKSIGGVCGISSGNISYCYNTGVLNTSGGSCGSVCGKISDGDITNCYYLDGTFDKGVGVVTASGSVETAMKSTDAFASGEVAWLLNGSEAGENPA
ncbi:MAG: hypothetical protein HUJ83_11160, partial [Veillonella sp.]|nr:hypothetical protein [Veillonella sp.]